MQHIEKMWPNYFQYLKRYPLDDLSKWSPTHDMGEHRNGIMNMNLSKSFTKVLKEAHSLSVTVLVCLSFEYLSKQFSVRRAIAARRREVGRVFIDKIIHKLNGHQLKSKEHGVVKYNNQQDLYEI